MILPCLIEVLPRPTVRTMDSRNVAGLAPGPSGRMPVAHTKPIRDRGTHHAGADHYRLYHPRLPWFKMDYATGPIRGSCYHDRERRIRHGAARKSFVLLVQFGVMARASTVATSCYRLVLFVTWERNLSGEQNAEMVGTGPPARHSVWDRRARLSSMGSKGESFPSRK